MEYSGEGRVGLEIKHELESQTFIKCQNAKMLPLVGH